MIYIGIDPGVNTGYAVWDALRKEFTEIGSGHMLIVMDLVRTYALLSQYVLRQVIIEDARLRKKFNPDEWNPKRYQGSGSIKRDCQLWEDFCKIHGIAYVMKHPRNTKIDAATFRKLTGVTGRTNEHARDASLLVYGLKPKKTVL